MSLDLLTSQDLTALKRDRPVKVDRDKVYLVLTYAIAFDRYGSVPLSWMSFQDLSYARRTKKRVHYPLPLNLVKKVSNHQIQELREALAKQLTRITKVTLVDMETLTG